MIPDKPLPYGDEFSSVEEYVDSLLEFASTADMFQLFAGGVHLNDLFISERSLFEMSVPEDWQPYILSLEPMGFVDLLLRDDLNAIPEGSRPPASLAKYIRDVRRLSLRRAFGGPKPPKLARTVALGMKPKKIHEVSNFAEYINRLTGSIATRYGKDVTHLVDFGSGQNYLGRTLALPPYNRHIVAVEGRKHNIEASRNLDVQAGLSTREKVHRNKKMWLQVVDSQTPEDQRTSKALNRAANAHRITTDPAADLRPAKELAQRYVRVPGKGTVSYVVSRLESGDLSDVIAKIEKEVWAGETGGTGGTEKDKDEEAKGTNNDKELRMMAISIHSCGNLSHYGIRSLIMNPGIQAVAIVGCCYNLLTEKLGPPTYKFPYVRPSLQAVNGRAFAESTRFDPEGFPLSQRLSTYKGDGVRFNITARMMACQAPYNWGEEESHHFFTRNLFRSVLQKIFLDKGVITKVYHREGEKEKERDENDVETPFNVSTNPIILGSLRKPCFASFKAYVRGAVAKLTTNPEYGKYSKMVHAKMSDMSDEELEWYEAKYLSRGKEVSAIWSLMAFSACIVESTIVTDRWLFLKEHGDVVQDCWVETVFDYRESPRNLVVVGIKK
ncbi:hypothetical protein SODALDRAFT_332760 [Sodiomyces alkalinus F11]|uniref:Methyltransferase domain-containing protein n=1 Tax=Sodiomyces alkalinus (strain CBS 110278 / VKM F-3762 / F11) TaxID=1314773 RepID=A0A3N2PXR1_SODAK|nr:hypothetical protein SODALDRAFT_332760 [Sodiomyces alkalinus F11]ROT39323.1 hypothetical protein SODALDRAFT_332760 [Sodiomyces alkalinus F11]